MDAIHTSLPMDHTNTDIASASKIPKGFDVTRPHLMSAENYILPVTNDPIAHNFSTVSDEVNAKIHTKSTDIVIHPTSPDINDNTSRTFDSHRLSPQYSSKYITSLELSESSGVESTHFNSFATPDRFSEQAKRRLVLDTPFSTRSTISYGLILYAKDTQRWAIIQRKHSVEFLLFIRGLYRLTHLPLLLSCITMEEADIIKRSINGGPSTFKHLFLKELELEESGLKYALIRMAESRNVVTNLLSKLDLSQNQLKWTWPKGRLQISSERETPFACAKREFTEEVELHLPSPLFISDTYVSESVRTITGRNIESRYWIYVIPHEIPMIPPNGHPEVSNRQWVSTDTCIQLIQHDSLFRQVADMITFCN